MAAWEGKVVVRVGQGMALLILSYQDGQEEIQEIDFIELEAVGMLCGQRFVIDEGSSIIARILK